MLYQLGCHPRRARVSSQEVTGKHKEPEWIGIYKQSWTNWGLVLWESRLQKRVGGQDVDNVNTHGIRLRTLLLPLTRLQQLAQQESPHPALAWARFLTIPFLTVPLMLLDRCGLCHSSWACPERSKHFWPSANTQFTTLFFFHKRQTLSRHVSTSSGIRSIIREGLWGRQALIDFWACAGWWSTLPPQTLHLLVAEQLPPAWCQPDSSMQLLRMSDLPLDVRWLVSRERYQKRGVRSCIMPLRILTQATARTSIPFSKRICESLPLVSSLLLSVIAHCSIWSPTQLLSKDFFDLSLLYYFIFLIPNSAVHFIIWT